MFDEVLNFWFAELEPKMWWVADPQLDDQIARRFRPFLEQAASGELFGWRKQARGRLAEVIVLDQFSRNIYRGKPSTFAQDPQALVLAQEAIAAGAPASLSAIERNFLYMPFMHSESRIIHQRAEQLFRDNGLEDSYDFELKHKAIIDRFGRYPHRNTILGRASTAEEVEFLQQPNSSF